MQNYNPHSHPSHDKSTSSSSSHNKRYKHKKKKQMYHHQQQQQKQRYSNNSDQKDDAKEAQIGFDSASNTISPHAFSDATVEEMSANLGFEQEYVRMALVQSNGDKAFAAEILFQLNDKTVKAIRKIEKQKKKHFDIEAWTKIFGCNAKQIKKQWKEQIIANNLSKSELRSLSRRQCLNNEEEEEEESESSDLSNSDFTKHTESFYQKNKNKAPKLCQSARSILFLLQSYQQFKAHKNGSQQNDVYWHVFLDSYLSHYSFVQLLNDFEHLHIFHWDHAQLFEEYEKRLGECSVARCLSFKRHFRNRAKYSKDAKRYKLYSLAFADEQMDDEMAHLMQREIVCLQVMDEIHCYLLHSLMKFDEQMDESDEDESEYEETTEYSSKTMTTQRHSPSNSRTNLSVHYDVNANINPKVQRQLSTNHRQLMQRKEELIKYGHARSYSAKDDEKESLNVFEWQLQSNKGYKAGPHFRTMKEEILHNPYCKLSIVEYNELHFKIEQICKSWIRKKIKAKEKFCAVIGVEFNAKKQKEKELKIKIKKSDPIPFEFIFAIKLYTDYDKLQHELKKCLRIGNGDKNQNDLSYFYWWHNLISLTVAKFGMKMKKHKFFYGCRRRMEFANYAGFGLFNGPLSMTISLEVAKQFATSKGMLLQIGNAHPWIKGNDNGNGRYFDVSCLSDFKNEHEILCMLFSTRLHMLSLNCFIDENISNADPALFDFVCKLFEKCVFSMNFELEQLLIQMLNFQLGMKVSKKVRLQMPRQYAVKLDALCTQRKELLLWDISYGLQQFFMVSTEYDDDFDDDSITIDNVRKYHDEETDTKMLISFEKINDLFANLSALTLINHTLSNEVFYQFIDYLNKNDGNVSFEIISFYFPKYKKLPHRLKVNQLEHVWGKYLAKHDWHIVGYKYGSSLSPMIVMKKRMNTKKIKPFMGQNHYQQQQFVKIEK